jgi:alkyl hydroperoxide reductase subunit F
MYDLAIIGGGPAGVAAGVYAARKRLKTVFVAETFGGQSTDSLDIQNWIGTPHIPGPDLAKALEAHLREYATDVVDLKASERASKVEKIAGGFLITTDKGSYEAKTVLVTTGGSRRKLDVPGAAQYENKGIVYCASCDGPLFAGQDTVVIGAGNAGFETAAQLLAYAKSVTLLNRSETFTKADAKTVEAVKAHPNMTILANTEPVEVKGAMFVNTLVVKNNKTGETRELPAGGIFVEIGALPATSLVAGVVEMDQFNHIKVDPRTQRAYELNQTPKNDSNARHGESAEGGVRSGTTTDVKGPHNAADGLFFGVWAAGDCTDGLYHQNNIAAGDAVKALEDIYLFVKAQG